MDDFNKNIPYISGLWCNAIFVKRANTHMDRMSHLKMVRSKLLGQSIILDFDYEQFMNRCRYHCSKYCYQVLLLLPYHCYLGCSKNSIESIIFYYEQFMNRCCYLGCYYFLLLKDLNCQAII